MLVVAMAMLLQANPPMDPLSQKMYRFCGSKPACVAQQFKGVRQFLNVSSVYAAPRPVTERCLKRATRKKVTNWSKAATCLVRWSKGRPLRPIRHSSRRLT